MTIWPIKTEEGARSKRRSPLSRGQREWAAQMRATLSGLILRQRPADEDRVVHILTREMGVITAYAKGARRPRSKLAAGTEALCYIRATLFKSKEWFHLDAAEVLDGFFALRKDITALSLCAYIAQLAEELAPRDTQAEDHLRLVLNAMHLLREKSRGERIIKAIVELRMLTLSGYMPDLVACRQCGAYESDEFMFAPISGDLVCCECAEQAGESALALTPGAVAAMRHIIYADFEDLFSFNLTGRSLELLYEASEQYLIAQLERRPQTLSFYSSMLI